jgi:outer membrane lipoprotein-sorting protein
MSRTSSSRWPWAVPAGAAMLVVAGTVLPSLGGTADAASALPDRTAEQLLADVATAEVDGLAGTVVQTSRLGLPELPEAQGEDAGALTALLGGSTTARVWYAGPDRQRLAVRAGEFAERVYVRDGDEAWVWDSTERETTHLRLPDGSPDQGAAPALTPQAAAQALLDAVDPTTEVTVGRAETVAGRPAYELVLTPRDEETLVDSVRIAVDGEELVPLRVRVYAEGRAEVAVEVGFTDVSFAVPDADLFAFEPPAGAPLLEKDLSSADGHAAGSAPADTAPGLPAPDRAALPTLSGSGWSTVVTLPAAGSGGEQAPGLLASLTRPVEGGRALSTALLSVLLLDDGRVLAGAVPVEVLLETARGR